MNLFQVTAADYICDACHILFNNNETSIINSQTRTVGHQNVCIQCGHSVTHSRYITVQAEQNQHIRNIVQDWIQPREVSLLLTYTCIFTFLPVYNHNLTIIVFFRYNHQMSFATRATEELKEYMQLQW